jgi:pimeloyl-ACP methyl ester carboxylesterase
MILTHGMYGTGSNWRGIARKVNARRPAWGIVLVDLRLHGRSEAGEPPHTVAACAEDLAALIGELGDIRIVAGHSFGGKVAMATRDATPLVQTWILDSTPSARPAAIAEPTNTVVGVLEMMRRLPRQWDKRDSFAAAIMAEGHGPALAQWLAMNLVPAAGAYELRLDLDALHALLVDYYAIDLWSSILAPRGDVEMVVAERSTTVSAVDRDRLASAPSHVHTHYVAADHWLHMEAPDAVVELFATHLPGTTDPGA